jgi:hypothetical protein
MLLRFKHFCKSKVHLLTFSYRMKNKQSPLEGNLSEELQGALQTFLSTVSVARLSKTLRNLFLTHVYHESDTPSADMEEFVLGLQALFDLLDVLETLPEQQT